MAKNSINKYEGIRTRYAICELKISDNLPQTKGSIAPPEIAITNKSMDGLQLKEVHFHQDAILMMVKRGDNFYIPHGETYFRLGDVLHVFGTDTAMEDTKRKLGA